MVWVDTPSSCNHFGKYSIWSLAHICFLTRLLSSWEACFLIGGQGGEGQDDIVGFCIQHMSTLKQLAFSHIGRWSWPKVTKTVAWSLCCDVALLGQVHLACRIGQVLPKWREPQPWVKISQHRLSTRQRLILNWISPHSQPVFTSVT
jgi:hypothetical protein